MPFHRLEISSQEPLVPLLSDHYNSEEWRRLSCCVDVIICQRSSLSSFNIFILLNMIKIKVILLYLGGRLRIFQCPYFPWPVGTLEDDVVTFTPDCVSLPWMQKPGTYFYRLGHLWPDLDPPMSAMRDQCINHISGTQTCFLLID